MSCTRLAYCPHTHQRRRNTLHSDIGQGKHTVMPLWSLRDSISFNLHSANWLVVEPYLIFTIWGMVTLAQTGGQIHDSRLWRHNTDSALLLLMLSLSFGPKPTVIEVLMIDDVFNWPTASEISSCQRNYAKWSAVFGIISGCNRRKGEVELLRLYISSRVLIWGMM